MNSKLFPGKETDEELFVSNEEIYSKFFDRHVIPFLDIKDGAVCMDVGSANPRMEYMKRKTGLNVLQLEVNDLNFDEIGKLQIWWSGGIADVFFVFDVIEHLQNPLWFMNQLKEAIRSDGSIYVLYPCNPRWLWHPIHYNEIPPDHFIRWIAHPLELEVVRQKKIIDINWKAYLIGFRPLWKVLSGQTPLRTFLRSLFYVRYHIFELKKT